MTAGMNVILAYVVINGIWRMLLLLPLAFSVAVVYKTTRCPTTREIPVAVIALWLTIGIGMFAVGLIAWLVFMICVEWTG